ncbi:unnamed protein product [Spodoptera exigua]|nr:unnamed protein product [Spodoptera exigua]
MVMKLYVFQRPKSTVGTQIEAIPSTSQYSMSIEHSNIQHHSHPESPVLAKVLRACFDTGLEVVGTVCDLDGVNIRAINSLGSSTDQPYFNFEGREVITILDPPHLLKCFRNIFLKHNIQFEQDIQIDGIRQQGLAKWSNIEDFFEKDQLSPTFVFAPGLTRQHLHPNGKQKMKVCLAAQVLSHSVAAGILARVAMNEDDSQEAVATSIVLSNLDKLFDAVNGDTPDRKRGKEFLTNMTLTSPHIIVRVEVRSKSSGGIAQCPAPTEQWIKEQSLKKGLPAYVAHSAGGHICPFGSYRLRVAELRALENGYVPIIKMTFSQIRINLLFASLDLPKIAVSLNLRDDTLLNNMDYNKCVRSVNSYRVTEEILRLVPNVNYFRGTLCAVKLWAKLLSCTED